LLLAGASIGLVPSTDIAVSLQKLAVIGLAVVVVLGIPRLGAEWRVRLCWGMLVLGLAASVAGNVLVDRNSWKLDALNRPAYALFAYVPRFSELAFSQNGLAALLVLVIPLAAALACGGARGRVLAGVVSAALIFELLVTESRAGILSLGLPSAVVIYLTRSRWRWAALLPGLAALAIVASGALTLPVTASWLPTGGSSAERLAIWQSSLLMIADMPLTGIGLGMFQRVYPLYILPAYENIHPHAHNLFLQTYLDAGPLGCAGIIALTLAAATSIVRLARRRSAQPLAIGAAVSTLAMLLHAQVDSYFAGDPRTYFLMFVPLGLLLACSQPGALRLTARQLTAGAMWVCGGVLLAMHWLAPIATVDAGSTARLKGQADLARAAFNQALRLQPRNWVAERGLGLVDSSIGALRAAITDGAPGPLVHLELAQLLDASGDESAAVTQWRLASAAPLLARSTDTHQLELATTVDPAYPAGRLRLAEAYLREGRWSAAERQLRACLQAQARPNSAGRSTWSSAQPAPGPGAESFPAIPVPQDDRATLAEAHLLLGLSAYWADDEPAPALEQLRAAVAADPDDDSLYRGLADLLDRLGRSDEASALRRQSESVARRTHRRSDRLGRAYEALGANLSLIPLAQREYRIVAAADPLGDYDLGQLNMDAGNLEEGLAQLQAAVRAIPNQEQFRLGLARAYLSAGDTGQARQQYEAVLDLDPANAEARSAATSPAGYRA